MNDCQVKRSWVLLLLLGIWVMLWSTGCVVTPTPEVTVQQLPISLSLNPSKTTLNPGDQVIISVVDELWRAEILTWELSSENLALASQDALSESTGPSVVYTAPDGSGNVTVTVTGRIANAVGSGSVVFGIEPKSLLYVVKFWTFPGAFEEDFKSANAFSQAYPDILIEPVSPSEKDFLSSKEFFKSWVLTAVAAGEAPEVVHFPRIADVQEFGNLKLLDADAATQIIKEIGDDRFSKAHLNALVYPGDNTRWLAVPTGQDGESALGILVGAENKSVAEAWVRFLIQKELKGP